VEYDGYNTSIQISSIISLESLFRGTIRQSNYRVRSSNPTNPGALSDLFRYGISVLEEERSRILVREATWMARREIKC